MFLLANTPQSAAFIWKLLFIEIEFQIIQKPAMLFLQ